MATTPEGWIKRIVKEMLDMHPRAYYHMPVQNGMGAPSLDFVCSIDGRYVAIEAKAPGKRMTDRQELTAKAIEAAGGEVFRDVGRDWTSVAMLYAGLFSVDTLDETRGCEWWGRWCGWYDKAEGKDAR